MAAATCKVNDFGLNEWPPLRLIAAQEFFTILQFSGFVKIINREKALL